MNTSQYFALLGTVYITPHLNNTAAVILCFLCLGIAVADLIYSHKMGKFNERRKPRS